MSFILDKVITAIDISSQKKSFNTSSNSYDFIVIAGNYPNFQAIKDIENCTLYTLFDKYTFKKNDQIVDANDISYFVETVDSKYQYAIDEKNTLIVQKITYTEKPLPLPNYISQNINTNITVNASGANLNDINISNSSSQQLSYTQILTDLENTINNCYHIKEYKEMIGQLKDNIKKQKPVEPSKFKKFFAFMGTQVRHLFELFVSAFGTALANKTLG